MEKLSVKKSKLKEKTQKKNFSPPHVMWGGGVNYSRGLYLPELLMICILQCDMRSLCCLFKDSLIDLSQQFPVSIIPLKLFVI